MQGGAGDKGRKRRFAPAQPKQQGVCKAPVSVAIRSDPHRVFSKGCERF